MKKRTEVKAPAPNKKFPVPAVAAHWPPPLVTGPIQRKTQAPSPVRTAGTFRSETRPAPPVYRPQQTDAGIQQKPAYNFRLETRPAPPVYRPQQTNAGIQQKPVNNFRLETRPAPPTYRPQMSTPPAQGVAQAKALATLKPVLPAAGNPGGTAHRNPAAPWFAPSSAIQRMNTRSTKRSNDKEEEEEEVVMTDVEEEEEEEEEESEITVRHRGNSLGKITQDKKAWKHAQQDIENKSNVYGSLPDYIQEQIQNLAYGFNSDSKVGVKKKIAESYIVSMAYIDTEKSTRSEKTPTPIGTCLHTFRMIGQILKNKFVEIAGTSYANFQPEGFYNFDTEFQSSHVVPSMLISEHKRSIGNTGTKKYSFVNQSYDRGSEEAIFKLAKKIEDPVYVGVEFIEVKKN